MKKSPHIIHIPVMGTGFSIDSAIRVGHFGYLQSFQLLMIYWWKKYESTIVKNIHFPIL